MSRESLPEDDQLQLISFRRNFAEGDERKITKDEMSVALSLGAYGRILECERGKSLRRVGIISRSYFFFINRTSCALPNHLHTLRFFRFSARFWLAFVAWLS